MGLLYLIGTCHVDLKGPERLRKFLGFVRPNYICLEYPEELVPQALEDRIKVKKIVKDQSEFEKAMEKLYLALGKKVPPTPADPFDEKFEIFKILQYEIWAPHEHRQEENPSAKIYAIHDVKLHARLQYLYDDFFKNLNPATETKGVFATFFKSVQELVEKIYADDVSIRKITEKNIKEHPEIMEGFKEMDELFARKIREIQRTHSDETGVFVCGADHFFGNGDNNTYNRLKDLNPIRLKLPEVDKF